MKKEDEYGQDVYRRLDLVRKQFRHSVAEQKKQESAEKRRLIFNRIQQNKGYIIKTSVFIVLAALIIAVIIILITN